MKRLLSSILFVLIVPVALLGARGMNLRSAVAPQISASKGTPFEINYQGWLGNKTDTTGVTGKVNIVCRLYTIPTGGSSVWEENQDSVQVDKGIFNVLLGSVNLLPAGIFTGAALYLETEVGGEIMSPRKKLVSVAYAIRADKADTADYALSAGINYVDSAGVSANAWRWNNQSWGTKYPKANEADTANYVAGADVDGEVANANRADTASYANKADTADYALPVRIDFRANVETPFTEVLNLGGLILEARCIYSMSYELEVRVGTTIDNSTIHFTYTFGSSLWGGTTQEGVMDEDFDTGESLSLLNVGSAGYYDVQGMLVYTSPTGSYVTVIFQAHDERGGTTPLGGTTKCLFGGTAFYSPSP